MKVPYHKFIILLIICCLLTAATPPEGFFTPLTSADLFPIAILTFGLVVFIILAAFYSGSETALVSVDKIKINRLAGEEHKKAKIVSNLLKKPEKMFGLTLVGANLANVVTAQLVLLLVIALLDTSEPTQENVALVVTTVLLLIFGELLPKTIFRAKADALTLRYAYPLRISEFILGFIVNIVTYFTDYLVKIIGKNSESSSPDARRDELRLLATMGEQSGELLRDQRRMIHSVLDLQTQTVDQVMVPLVDIVAVEKNTDVESFLRTASESGYSRIPVYEGQIYNIVGIIHLLDVIYDNRDATTIERFVRTDLHVVPESKKTSVLLKEIQHSRHTMVFVVNEYGGVVGLITVEDLVEEIVGEFSHEEDEGSYIRLVSLRILECEGRAEVSVLHDRFGVPIPFGDYETVAGYILEQTGTIPRPGDEIETDNLIIVISDADARSIRRVRLRNKVGSFITREV